MLTELLLACFKKSLFSASPSGVNAMNNLKNGERYLDEHMELTEWF